MIDFEKINVGDAIGLLVKMQKAMLAGWDRKRNEDSLMIDGTLTLMPHEYRDISTD